ncbi:DNA internalization-related competence protein ComEC/Rec2 [hydrothermal vent metagenome]|uniref:DNA internalization-related competence protein ComEC/Rec2 n=1 Tax=hydrothermal vent metagenome TaxID=652676 RepID=A0A1W1CHY5_9ZZZZ
MLTYALSFLLGIVLFSTKTTLFWAISEISILIFLLIIGLWKRKNKLIFYSIIAFIFGWFWMGLNSYLVLGNKVDNNYFNKEILIEGVVVNLPKKQSYKSSFNFKVEKPFQAKIKLSWYQKNHLKAGDRWQLLVKLKQNNGFQNPAGFDYEKWLFSQKINATGYVKKSVKNQFINSTYSLNTWRGKIREKVLNNIKDLKYSGVLLALILGDRSYINSRDWQIFTQTNTSHLTVISGLHIGLIAGLIFFLFRLFYSFCHRCCLKIPAQVFSSFWAIVFAFIYALLADFSVPTQRAFVMVLVFFSSYLLRRFDSRWRLYSMALIIVLLIDPLSVLTVGFWLSFGIVFAIIYGLHLTKNKNWLFRVFFVQFFISLVSIPLLLFFFQSISLSSPIANLIAVPIVSVIVLPLVLLASLLLFLGGDFLATILFKFSNDVLANLMLFLEFLQGLDFNIISFPQVSLLESILLMIALLVLFLPRGLKVRRFGFIILIIIIFNLNNTISQKNLKVVVLDVGQSLAIIVEINNKTLVFDTGFSSRSGFNIADSVILPYLQSQNIKKIDKLVISHLDNDHFGGFQFLKKQLSIDEVLTSEPQFIPDSKLCVSGDNWDWDKIHFEFLHPNKNSIFKRNNKACVLKISNSRHSILLTSDIEKKAESELLTKDLSSTILLVPHHGSLTSSSMDFVKAVSPSIAIVSTGFNNRFSFPKQEVFRRYQSQNIQFFDTKCSGAIEINFTDEIKIKEYRFENQKYWTRTSC